MSNGHGVLLLHGFGRFGGAMAPIARAARHEGYATLAPSYRSRRPIAEILDGLAPPLDNFEQSFPGQLHIVTHSFGGLIARALITARRPVKLGRVVMLAPPHGGSELADMLHRLRLASLVLGASRAYLGTRRAFAEDARLGPVDYDLGIIAGDHPTRRPGSNILPRPHDGKVSVVATRISGLRDHLTLPVGHTSMLGDRDVIDATFAFLAQGRFP